MKDAGFGPVVDIVMQTPTGSLADPRRLDQIEGLERRLRRIEHVKTVVGPSTIGEQTKEIRDAPQAVKRGKRQLRRGKRQVKRLDRGLGDATQGVKELRAGLIEAAGGSAGAGRRVRARPARERTSWPAGPTKPPRERTRWPPATSARARAPTACSAG